MGLKKIIIFAAILILAARVGSLAETRWVEPVHIRLLGGEADEFAPSWNRFENALYFNSTVGGDSKFYVSERIDSFSFSPARLVPGSINESGSHQSYITFVSESEAFYSTYRMNGRRSILNIFRSRVKKQVWSAGEPFDSLNFNSFTAHPTVSPDGSVVVFSSNYNSEESDADLWMAFRQDDGSWGPTVCLNEINSPGNEITPFLASADTLYFASNGQQGAGGYDILTSVRSEGIWQRPRLLSDLNGEFDDSDFILLPDGAAVFASNRPDSSRDEDREDLDLYIAYPAHFEEIVEEPLQGVEFSLAAQVTSLKAKKYVIGGVFGVVPYIFFDYGDSNPNKFFYIDGDADISNFASVRNGAALFSQKTIAERLKRKPDAELELIAWLNVDAADLPGAEDMSETDMREFLARSKTQAAKDYFANQWNINPNRIKISYVNTKEKVPLAGGRIDFIGLSSDRGVFEPIDTGGDSLAVLPPKIEASVDARPRNVVKTWKCSLVANDEEIALIAEGEEIPAKFAFDVRPYKNEIWFADSLFIKISGKDELGRIASDKLRLYLSKNTIRESELVAIGGKVYNEFALVLADENLSEVGSSFDAILDKIAQSTENGKSVLVSYYAKTSEARSRAEYLKEMIQRKISGKKVRFKIEFSDKKPPFNMSEELKSVVFRVLVEKSLQSKIN